MTADLDHLHRPDIQVKRVIHRAGVDDPSAFPISRMRRHRRVDLPVQQHGRTFPSTHPIHLRYDRVVSELIERQVRDDQDSLDRGGDRCDVAHDDGAIAALEVMLGGQSVGIKVRRVIQRVGQ